MTFFAALQERFWGVDPEETTNRVLKIEEFALPRRRCEELARAERRWEGGSSEASSDKISLDEEKVWLLVVAG
jgi:hypothetical protein